MTNDLAGISILMGLFYAFVHLFNRKIHKLILSAGFLFGCGIGITVFLIKINNPKGTNLAIIRYHRYMIVGVAALSVLALLATLIWKQLQRNGKDEIVISYAVTAIYALIALASTALIFPTCLQYTTEFVYFGEDSISSMMLMRVIGFTLGLSLAYLLFYNVYQVISAMPVSVMGIFLLLSLSIQSMDYIVKSIISMQRLKWIPLNHVVFQIMIFGDNYGKVFLFAMIAVMMVAFIYVFLQNRKISGEFPNSALRRKAKAKARNRRRWGIGLLVEVVSVMLIVTVLHYYDTKEVELTPPQDYLVEGDYLVIPLSDISDGHLHRFSYHTPNGFDVRFIAVKKPQGTTYGLGLDACDICGIAGYFERGDEVICKRCDVVMNKNTIGFYGGCNPVPFPYEIKDAKVYIHKKDLEKEEMRFR